MLSKSWVLYLLWQELPSRDIVRCVFISLWQELSGKGYGKMSFCIPLRYNCREEMPEIKLKYLF